MERPDPLELDDVYDEDILARIDRVTASPPYGWVDDVPRRRRGIGADIGGAVNGDAVVEDAPIVGAIVGDAASEPAAAEPARHPDAGDAVVPRYPVARRLGISGAMLAGSMLGLGEVLEGERKRHHIGEYSPAPLDEHDRYVTYQHVPGSPAASRIIVRPWLLEAFRQRRGRPAPGSADRA